MPEFWYNNYFCLLNVSAIRTTFTSVKYLSVGIASCRSNNTIIPFVNREYSRLSRSNRKENIVICNKRLFNNSQCICTGIALTVTPIPHFHQGLIARVNIYFIYSKRCCKGARVRPIVCFRIEQNVTRFKEIKGEITNRLVCLFC